MTTPRRFISLIAILAAVCAALVAVSSVDIVDILFGLPLALFLPGAALVAAVDPWGGQVKGPERAMWAFGSSIGIVILGGLLLNLTGGLTRPHWLILSAAVVAVSTVISWFRSGEPAAVDRPDAHSAGQEPARRVRGTLSLRACALLLAAVLVVAGALVLSQRTSAESSREHFVQAWVLPQPSGNVYSTRAQLGVRNEEGDHEVLIVRLRVGSSNASTLTVGLNDGQEWTHEVSRGAGQTVSATVAKASDTSSVLARVDLAKPS
jgi:uncharacterized membrane protein